MNKSVFFGLCLSTQLFAESLEIEMTENKELIFLSTENRVVLAETDDSLSACTSAIYPPNLLIEDGLYSEFNDGYPFGQSTNTNFIADISTNEFLSLSGFNLTTPNTRRRIVSEVAPVNYNPMDQGTISVSRCPGDFSETAVCRFVVNTFSVLLFSTNQNDDPGTYCILDPAKTYYINYVMSADPYVELPTCLNQAHQSCAIFYIELIN